MNKADRGQRDARVEDETRKLGKGEVRKQKTKDNLRLIELYRDSVNSAAEQVPLVLRRKGDQTFGLCIVPISARPKTARKHEHISLSCICKRVLCQASDGFELESFEMNDSNGKQRDGLLPPSAVAVWEAGHVLRGRPKQSE